LPESPLPFFLSSSNRLAIVSCAGIKSGFDSRLGQVDAWRL
jgi:hypothetical protein